MRRRHEKEHMQIGRKSSYYRKSKGLTREQLAEKIGISTAFLGQVEAPNVEKSVSLYTLFDIAYALEIPPQNLLIFD